MLRKKYLENPCSFQPTALWKYLKMTSNFKKEMKVVNDEVVNIIIENEFMLHTYWVHREHNIYPKVKDDYHMMILHDNFINKFDVSDFLDEEYFKLIHNLKMLDKIELNRRFSFKTVDISKECNIVSDIICKCYSDIRVDPKIVFSWTKEKVFDNSLWVLVIDNIKNTPVALGIGECDKENREGSLEWIQVLPKYRRCGVGTALVIYLLERFKEKTNFVTVSGEINNITKPQRLYEKCGFQGNDVWHILKKEQKK